jgi:GAF domain-containing protein
MSRTARRLQEEHGDVEGTLQAITSAAIIVVPGAEECGISYVIGRSRVEPRASTSDLPRQVDALQERLGQGPCMDAVWEQQVVRVDDVGADDRWPEFARQASELGVGSMLCFQLFVAGDQLGGLNLYAGKPGAFDDESQDMGQMFAAHAAVAVAGAEHEENLRAGMGSRDVIGQAKGILMERYKLTADQAFGVLTRVSQELNRKLADVAGELTDTGVVPVGDRRRD